VKHSPGDEETEKEVSKSSFPVRMAHTTKSFVFSIFSPNNGEPSSSAVRRFEWYADGASEFLRLLELGGRPRRPMPFDPLVRHLLNGKQLHHRIIQANRCPLFLQLMAYVSAEYGIEASLIFFLCRQMAMALFGCARILALVNSKQL